MEALSLPHILIIGAVVILLFGGRKIPELMKGIGLGIHEFKKGISYEPEDKNEDC